MKTSVLRLSGLIFLLSLLPAGAAAQTNIKSAFDAIIKCREAQITESHTLDKDPATNVKTGQSDVYRFVLPADKAGLIRNVVSAFDKDAGQAYSINSGRTVNTESDIVLAVGNDENGGVDITQPGCDYIYALFLAPVEEDPNGIYRYAYGMTSKEVDGKLEGKLVVTYATTLKYRQQIASDNQAKWLSNFSNGAYVISSPQSWFDKIMKYFQSMTQANSQTRIALATKAYKLIRDVSDYPEVTEADKNAVREILRGMIPEKKYSETVLNKLLNQCLVTLK